MRALGPDDLEWRDGFLRRTWGAAVARKGILVDVLSLDGFVAVHEGRRAGLLTYATEDEGLEVVSIQADPEGIGVGRALMDAALGRARTLGLPRLWLITTNDNIRAIRFYQRWGMDLAALHRNGVDRSRAVKPSIPLVGVDGIPIRHELEFELVERTDPAGTT